MRTPSLPFVAALAILRLAQLAQAQDCGLPLFVEAGGNAQTAIVGNEPSMLAAGDMDNDGDTDIVVTVSQDDTVVVLLNDGEGRLAVSQTLACNDTPNDVVLADFNMDGWLDAATAGLDDNYVCIYFNEGAGGLALQQMEFVSQSTVLAAGDLSGDGVPDIAAGGLDAFVLLLNDGTGYLTDDVEISLFATGQFPIDAMIADLDLDGANDLLATTTGFKLYVRFGDGTVNQLGTGSYSHIALSNIDNDAWSDVVLADANFDMLWVYKAFKDDGEFVLFPLALEFIMFGSGIGATPADFNGDGAIDLGLGGTIRLSNNNGSYASKPQLTSALVEVARFSLLADMNADGRPDMVVMDSKYFVTHPDPEGEMESLRVLLNTGQSYGPPIATPVAANGHGLATDDLDGDGNLEAIVTGHGLSIQDFDPAGSSKHVDLLLAGVELRAVVTGDWDADGDADIAAAGPSLYVVVRDGAGWEESTPLPLKISSTAPGLDAGDFDGDGDLDLVVVGTGLQVFLNDGAGIFTPGPTPTPPSGNAVSVGDLNGDQLDDIVVNVLSQKSVKVLYAVGDGYFKQEPADPALQAGEFVVIGDFNGDGRDDLMTTIRHDPGRAVAIRYGTDSGLTGYHSFPFDYFGPFEEGDVKGAATADLNGDGALDVIVSMLGHAVALLNDGSGEFGAATTLSLSSSPPAGKLIAAGDFTGSGGGEVLVVRPDGLILHRPTACPPPCPFDLDRSGAIDAADLNALLGVFGCALDNCPWDLDLDGGVGSADLNLLLAAFGQPCPG